MRKFPLFHMASINDIFPEGEDYSWIKPKEKMNIAKMYGATSKRHLAIQIYHAFMKKALEDMVEDNVAIELPAFSASLLVEQIPEKVFDSLKGQGKLEFYSTLFTNGKVYIPMYRYKKHGVCQKYRVILGKGMFERLVDLVNSGKRYFGYSAQW